MLKPVLALLAATAALSLTPMTSADAAATVTPCSDFFGADVKGIIMFTDKGIPNLFTCRGGIFPDPPTGSSQQVACSDLFGEEVRGIVVFTRGAVSVFTCKGGPFPG